MQGKREGASSRSDFHKTQDQQILLEENNIENLNLFLFTSFISDSRILDGVDSPSLFGSSAEALSTVCFFKAALLSTALSTDTDGSVA